MSDADAPPPIEFLDVWRQSAEHQRSHGSGLVDLLGPPRPSRVCVECTIENRPGTGDEAYWDLSRQYSWAIPTENALTAVANYSPRGVVEIGAGGGYWAMLLRERGVDVVAYDPDPIGPNRWHTGRRWATVTGGDHTVVRDHPDRTLLLCWPEADAAWAGEVVQQYAGDTVIHIGELGSITTGDDRMHALLGDSPCCHDQACDCDLPPAQFGMIDRVALPNWLPAHDELYVHARVSGWGTSGGIELTNKVIGQLVAQAEHGYELHQLGRKKP